LIASWGQTTPTIYDGYGSWAGKTQPAIPHPADGYFSYGYGDDSYINNLGLVASNTIVLLPANSPYTTTTWHAVFYNGQNTSDLGTLGGQNSTATGVNDAGQVVGYSDTVAGTCHAFLASGGRMTDLGTLPGGQNSTAMGVNGDGQAVGFAQVGSAGGPRWQTAPGFPSGPLFGGGYTAHAVLYQGGRVIDLGTLGGASSASVAINQSGAIVGTSETSSGAQHAFLYQNGHMQDLGVLSTDFAHTYWGVSYSQAHAINDAGEVVGDSNSLAFLSANGKMYNLNDLVIIPGVTLTSAYAINNAGQILAAGYTGDPLYRYSSNEEDFLLNPVGLPGPECAEPEPSTLMIVVGLAAWLAGRRLRRASPC
jgi:probable HAF family extracellular repeat protein